MWRRTRLGGMRLGWEQQWDWRVVRSASHLASSPLWPCPEAESWQQDWVISLAVPRASLNVYQHPRTAAEMAPASAGCWGEGHPAWATLLGFSHYCPCCGSERGPHPCLVHHT